MIGIEFTCARPECNNKAVKTTHNQKYCCNECCRIETNRKVMERYHEKAAIKNGKKRVCKTCGMTLSRYNPGKNCSSCEVSNRKDSMGSVAQLVSSVSWL